jgi:hypothetical protein
LKGLLHSKELSRDLKAELAPKHSDGFPLLFLGHKFSLQAERVLAKGWRLPQDMLGG